MPRVMMDRMITKATPRGCPSGPVLPVAGVLTNCLLSSVRRLKHTGGSGATGRAAPLSISEMEIDAAAARWAETWARAWPAKDLESIVALYADTALYRSQPFRGAREGREGVRAYLQE